MKKTGTLLVTCLYLAAAPPIAARERSPISVRHIQKQGSGVIDRPVEPVETRNDKSRAGWNEFYGGLNAGASFNDSENR